MFQILRNELNCFYVLCEGGGHLALSLLENNFIDEFHLHIAPMILGDESAPALFSGRHPLDLEEALKMKFVSSSLYGDDAHLILRPVEDAI